MPLATAISRSSGSSGPRPIDHEVGVDVGHRAHEHVGALVVDEPADEQHDRAAVCSARSSAARAAISGVVGVALDVDAEGDDAALVGDAARGTRECSTMFGERRDDEVDAVEHALEERAVDREQALLPHDVAVVGQHRRARRDRPRSHDELAPRVREVQVEEVGRLGARRLGARSRGPSRARRASTRSANCARQARDLDAVDRPRRRVVAPSLRDDARARARPRARRAPSARSRRWYSMPPRCGG